MEFKIYNPDENSFIQAIEWNNEEIKAELKEKLELYKNLVYTDEQISEAKADRAKLNKFVTALEDKRKELKKTCLAPYEKFEKQVKELVFMINEPIALIDTRVKSFEEEKKNKKLEEIKEYYAGLDTGFPTFEQLYNPKWLNASVSMASIKKEIDVKLGEINKELEILENLEKFSFEAIFEYKKNLDLSMAMSKANELRQIEEEKRKKEILEQLENANKNNIENEENAGIEKLENEEIRLGNIENGLNTTDTSAEIKIEQENTSLRPSIGPGDIARKWIGFEAYLSREEVSELANFFKSKNIQVRRPNNQ